MNANTRKKDISAAVRRKVRARDGGCIFCQNFNFRPTGANTEIMHYIGRGRGGLGIEENLAVGCIVHHRMMDQGGPEDQQNMRAIFRSYLRAYYPDWNEAKLMCKNRWELDDE